MYEMLLKIVDRQLSRPALSLVQWARGNYQRRSLPAFADLSTFLLIRPGGLGDAVLLLPLLKFLQQHQKKVVVAGMARNAGILELYRTLGYIQSVSYLERLHDFKKLSAEQVDCVIDTEQGFTLSSLYSRCISSLCRIGFDVGPKRVCYDAFVSYRQEEYEAQSFLTLLAPLGQHIQLTQDQLRIPEISLPPHFLSQELSLEGKKILAFHQGAQGLGKRLTLEQSIQLLSGVAASYDKIVVIGGADCSTDAQAIVEAIPRAQSLVGKTSVGETVAVLQRCAAFAGTDSGPLHLAVVSGVKKIVACFGPSVEKKWAYALQTKAVVSTTRTCRPCNYGRFAQTPPCPFSFACMKELDIEAACRMLQEGTSL